MEVLSDVQIFLFTELADPRVQDWPLMATPWKLFAIIVAYLFAIYLFVPSYMEHKKPYGLKWIIRAYDVFEIISNLALLYGLITHGWSGYTFGCQTVDYSRSRAAGRMASWMWFVFVSKMIQLIETVFYGLRKKQNQISVLHVYHHASTAILAWILAKYFPGGMGSFVWLINCFIHVLMYTYYLVSSFGLEMRKKLDVVKSKLTLLQIVQLCLIILHAMQSFSPTCSVPATFGIIMVSDTSVNLYLFIRFYMESYNKKMHVN